jgi:hypothetical protein
MMKTPLKKATKGGLVKPLTVGKVVPLKRPA